MSGFSNNPLSKHFRQPILYLQLPSQGRWWAQGALDLPANGQIPVYAMTARDEITLKTPDSLMNGTSTVQVIESCCPSINDAWKIPTVDLDPILIAIRLATYGKEMEFTAICPHCETVVEQAIDLSVLLSRVSAGDWSKTVSIDGLEIILKPQNYEDYNKNNQLNFEEQRLIQVVQDESLTAEERTKTFDDMFRRVIETGIAQVSKSIAGIKIEDGTIVDNPGFIKEFLDNCDKSIWTAIKNRLEEIRDDSTYSDVTLTCTNETCGKTFITPFVFEQSNFFGLGS